MDRSKRKPIRQLEHLQAQIDKLKQNYLTRLDTAQHEKQAVEKVGQPSHPTPHDDKIQEKTKKLLELTIRTGKESDLYKAVTKKLRILLKSGKTSFSPDNLQEIQQTM